MNMIKIRFTLLIMLLMSTFFLLPLSRRVFNEQLTNKLFSAVQKGAKNDVVTLLEQGANPNAKQKGKTVLMVAISWARAYDGNKIIEILLENGADANTIDSSLMTPLELATYYEKDFKIINLLIQYGAQITPRVNLEYTPGQRKIKKADPYVLARKKLMNEKSY